MTPVRRLAACAASVLALAGCEAASTAAVPAGDGQHSAAPAPSAPTTPARAATDHRVERRGDSAVERRGDSAVERGADSGAVVAPGNGRLSVVPVSSPGSGLRQGTGRLRRYTVEVEDGLGLNGPAFAAAVERTLADPRSWGAAGRLSFQRVDSDPVSLRVALVSPRTTDRLCAPLQTGGIYSCASGSRAVLNTFRWAGGAAAYRGRLADYRVYLVNHEVGHVLGHGHAGCPGGGQPAPVMMQQTKGVGACRPSPWPFPG